MVTLQNRIRGMFLGVAIGDALGSAYEGQPASRLKDVDVKIGHTTDDTQLTRSVAQAIIDTGSIDMDAVAKQHVKALQESTRGWGSTTREAIKKIEGGCHWQESGDFTGVERKGSKDWGVGNGIPMKLAPVAAYYAITQELNKCAKTLVDFTGMTHRTSIAVSSAFAHTTALHQCLIMSRKSFNVKRLIKKIARASEIGRSYFADTLKDDITDRIKSLVQIYEIPDLLYNDEYLIGKFGAGSCYVYNSLPFSYAYFMRGPFSLKTIYEVIRAGGDVDTNASIVGGMVGALVGTRVFPKKLINELEDSGKIIAMADDLYKKLTLQTTKL